jgi:hypothetical protein
MAKTIARPMQNTTAAMAAVRPLTVPVARYSRIGCNAAPMITAIRHMTNLPFVMSFGLAAFISSQDKLFLSFNQNVIDYEMGNISISAFLILRHNRLQKSHHNDSTIEWE